MDPGHREELGHGLDSFWGHGDLTLFFPDAHVDLERSCCLVTGGFDFTPCEERHVHRNHMVGVVRLVRVNGQFEWDPISSPINVEFSYASSRDVP